MSRLIKYSQRAIWIMFLTVGLVSCKTDGEEVDTSNAVARVNSTYLDKNKVEDVVPLKVTGQDSIAYVHRFIDKWATKQLLIEVAQLNLDEDRVVEIERLVESFKSDLYIKAYLERLVQNRIDTVISDTQMREYYDMYKKNFLVDDMLIQFAYINVLNDNSNFSSIKKKFNSSKVSEFNSLENLSLQMKSYYLNDSTWVEISNIYDRLPFINVENSKNYIRSNNRFEHADSVSTYFVRVKSVIPKGGVFPYEFIKTSLRSLIINDRKVELMKQIQEDIIKDAKNNKRYEIFE